MIGGKHTLCPQLTPNPEATIQMTASHFHGREHLCSAPPAIQVAKGPVCDHSAGKDLQKRGDLLDQSFPSLSQSRGGLGSLARCAHQDGLGGSVLALMWDQS